MHILAIHVLDSRQAARKEECYQLLYAHQFFTVHHPPPARLYHRYIILACIRSQVPYGSPLTSKEWFVELKVDGVHAACVIKFFDHTMVKGFKTMRQYYSL